MKYNVDFVSLVSCCDILKVHLISTCRWSVKRWTNMQPNISNYSRDRQFKGSRAGGKIQYSKGALNFHIFKFLKHQSKSVITCPGLSSLTALSFASISSPSPKPSYTTVWIWSTRQLKLSLPPPHLILVAQIHILQIIRALDYLLNPTKWLLRLWHISRSCFSTSLFFFKMSSGIIDNGDLTLFSNNRGHNYFFQMLWRRITKITVHVLLLRSHIQEMKKVMQPR